MLKDFKHLKDNEISYLAHFFQANRYSWCLLKCAFKLFIHSLWPDVYVTDASEKICELHKEMHKK